MEGPSRLRCMPVTALLACGFLVFPVVARAHGLSVDDDPQRPLIQYVVLGFEHMAVGWDHLLFILGCVLLAPSVRSAAKLVSLFVLGHSLTLLVATLAGWKVNVTAVDVAIALSVVFVGALGIWRGEKNWRLVGAVVFGFGLVHGLGLSTRLQEIALPDDGLATRIVLFNVGIELGQLAVLLLVVGVWKLVSMVLPRPQAAERVAFGGLVAAGLVAAMILPFTASTEPAVATSTCSEADYRPTTTGGGGGHPPKRFFAPSEVAPREDMGHVLFDGWVVITYKVSLPDSDRAALKTWIEGKDQAVVAAAANQREALNATTVRRSLTCAQLDLAALTRFRDAWFGS